MGGRGIKKKGRNNLKNKLSNLFNLSNYNTTIRKEAIAGLTSFFTIVYIIVVNSSILSDAGIPIEAGIIATVLSSFVGCILVASIANAPIILVPGMGVNALFSYTIVMSMGLSWQQALAAVFVSGIVFSMVAFTTLTDVLTKSIPTCLKQAITVGIGLLITFIGLQKGGVIVASSKNFVTLGNLSHVSVYVTLINLALTVFLFIKNIPANFLISMICSTIISYFFGLVDVTQVSFTNLSFGGYKEVFLGMSFSGITTISFWIAVFSLTLVLVFENLGLLHGQVDVMLKEHKKFKPCFKSTALSAISCGIFGTSPTVATVETAAGITAGGRTGVTSIVTALLFLVSLFLLPIIKIIPSTAIAPILIVIGGLMMENILNINLKDFSDGFPAFLTIIMIPLTFSIVDGIAFGFIAYPIAKVAAKKGKEISIPMYVISIIFLLNFILHTMS